jgi:lipopolysaccharide assembly outer membrane protein LptD (OstA)
VPTRIGAAALLGLLLVAPTVAGAQGSESVRESFEQEGFTLRADEIEYEEARDLYVASGNVRIEQATGRVLTADWVTFSANTRMGVATGNVEMVDGDDRLRARFAAVDFTSLVALLTDAQLEARSTGYVIEARSLEKSGDQTYRIQEGLITTCRCPPDVKHRPFEVEAQRTDIRVGGYAVARHARFRVLDVPVLYVPWLILPVKTERQSGFLLPNFGSGNRGGFELETPFFWAAKPNLNVLLRPAWISKRGFRPAMNVEYVFGEEGYGRGGAAGLPGDDEIEASDPDTRFSDDRWAYWLRYEHPLGPARRLGLDLLQMSDNNYPLDFGDLPGPVRNLRFTESRGWASYASGPLFANVEAVAFDDLQSPNDLDRDNFLLHRVPDVRLASLPSSLGPLPFRAALDVRYTYFHQLDHPDDLYGVRPVGDQFFDTGPDGLFNFGEPDRTGALPGDNVDRSGDDLSFEGNGIFEEGEPLADRGHRIDLYPRLVRSDRFGPVETLAEVGFRETLYFPRRGQSETRELWTARIDTRTRLERLFRLGALSVRHVVEPSLGFGFVSRQDQEDNTLFLPTGSVPQERVRGADLRVRLRNPTDRIPDERFGLVAVTNRLFAPATRVGEPARQLGELRLGTGYDFEEDRILNLFLEGEFHPTSGYSLELELGYDPKDDDMDEALASFSWSSPIGHSLSVSYRYVRNLPEVFEDFQFSSDIFDEADRSFNRINQLSLSGRYPLTRRIELFGSMFLSFEESRTQQGTLGFELHSRCDCWDLIVSGRQSTRPSQTELQVQIRLAGIGLGLPELGGR